jgi:single-strand DNA-binding protein
MYSLNRAQVLGNVTRDPEKRQTTSGQQVASFSIATNRAWTDASGAKQEQAEYHNIVAWGKLADIIGSYAKKGTKIYAEGRIQTRDWQGQDGVKRYRTEIVADNVILLDRATSGSSMGSGMRAPTALQPKDEPSAMPDEEIKIEDIPF